MLGLIFNVRRFFKALFAASANEDFRAVLTLASITLLSGVLFYRNIEGWSWIDSLYFCVTTVSTVGFGDLTPQTDIGKLFTTVYIIVGVGVFVLFFTRLAQAMIEETAKSKKQRARKKAEKAKSKSAE